MAMVRVWNITDGGRSGMSAHNRMILGKSVKPGRAIQVEESRLIMAHRVHKDVKDRLLHIGPRPPSWYSQKKKPVRVVADARVVNDKGQMTGKKVFVTTSHVPLRNVVLDKPVEMIGMVPVEESVEEPMISESAPEAPLELEEVEDSSSRKSRKKRR